MPKFLLNRPEITEKDLEGKTEEEQDMMKMMGFGGFDTTKGKKVPGNDVSAVHTIQKRKYRYVFVVLSLLFQYIVLICLQLCFHRQYMNRKGGFNRPLDPVA